MITPLTKLQEELWKNPPAGGLDAILISSISNIIYLTNYSGFSKEEREVYLLIVNQPQRLTHKTSEVLGYILTDGRYSEEVKTLIPDFRLIEISSNNPLMRTLKNLAKKHNIKKLGFESKDITVSEHKTLAKCYNMLVHVNTDNLRVVKDIEEIARIEKACKLGDKTFNYILKKIKLGISEKEVANEIEFFIKKNGADISFRPIVAFGKKSAIPHHVPTNNKLTNNQIVLLDFGVRLGNYCSDMTRTVFFGSANAEFKKMYNTVLEAQRKAIQQLNNLTTKQSTIKASKIDKIARDYIISKGYPTTPHSLGHGIGIDVHEAPHLSPKSKDILKEGMVFSIEPGIYIPNSGGIRIEDLVVLEKKGIRLLAHSQKEIIEL